MHYFNCPFQLALPTPGYSSMADKPEKGDLYDIESFENMGKIEEYFSTYPSGATYGKLTKF